MLFDPLVVFQNYPLGEAVWGQGGSRELELVRWVQKTHYPVTLFAVPGSELVVTACYDARQFDRATIRQVLDRLERLLEGIVASPASRLGELLDALPATPTVEVDRTAPRDRRSELQAAYIAPRTPAEEAMAGIWGELLGVDAVGVRDDFFELGGRSLLASRLFAEIEGRFEVRLPLALLFENATVEHLAAALDRAQKAPTPWSSLVPIRPVGTRPPLFLAPTVSGEVFEYSGLIRHLSPDQPVYGLQALGLSGREHPHTTVEAMAAHFVTEILRVQREDPYLVAGYCFGGQVAYEIGRQLADRGASIALLAVIDAAPTSSTDPRLPQLRHFFDVGLGEKLIYARRRWRNLGTIARHRLRSLSFDLHLRTRRPLPARLRDVEEINYLASSRYVARASPCRVTVFQAGDRNGTHLPVSAWSPVAGGGVEVHRIESEGVDHLSLMAEPHVRVLAEALTGRIEKACAQSTASYTSSTRAATVSQQ